MYTFYTDYNLLSCYADQTVRKRGRGQGRGRGGGINRRVLLLNSYIYIHTVLYNNYYSVH